MEQLTRNFHRKEFDCKDGTKVPEEFKNNLVKLAVNLQVLRDDFGSSLVISSGYRTPKYNKRVGGATLSQHLTASASDLSQNKETPLELYKRIERLIKQGKMHNGGLGLYNTFVHYDIRQEPTRWNNSKFRI